MRAAELRGLCAAARNIVPYCRTYSVFSKFPYNPLRTVGHIRPTRIDLWTDPISPRRPRVSASLHAADTLWHACIDFLTYSDDHASRQSGLCPSGERSRSSTRGKYVDLPIISSSFEMATVVKGLYKALSIMLNNPLRTVGHIRPTRIDLWTDPISPRRPRVSASLHAADTLWHACIDFLTYSDDHASRQSGLCPSGERSRSSTRGKYVDLPIISSSFEMSTVVKGLNMTTAHKLQSKVQVIRNTAYHAQRAD